jgi:hypothetical protein
MHGGENDLGLELQFQHERNPKRVKAKELVERSDSRPDLDPTENLWDKLKRRSELFQTI